MLNKPMYGNPIKNTSETNPVYSGFWDEQKRIRQDILGRQDAADTLYKADRAQAREDYRMRPIKEAQWQKEDAEWRAKHIDPNLTGNFFNDFAYGFKSANRAILQPFNKYVAPVLSIAGGPMGGSIASATKGFSGVVEKL